MNRADFLAHVGDPAVTLDAMDDLLAQAQTLWSSVKGEFFTAAGKIPKKPPSYAATQTEKEVNRLRGQARILEQKAYDQRRAASEPWSHIQTHWLRKYDLEDAALRVEAAHRAYIAQAESA